MAELDKPLIAQRFAAHITEYDEHAIAQQQINRQLVNLLAQTNKQCFRRVLEIGCGTGDLTQHLMREYQVEHLAVNDLSNVYQDCVVQKIDENRPLISFKFIAGDAEHLAFDGQFDLISSASAVQWFEQPQTFVSQAAKLLQPNGVLLFNSFTTENLAEIRELTGVGLTYPSPADWHFWLSKDFTQLQIMQRQIRLTFASPLAVLQHLRKTGVTAISTQTWTRKKLMEFSEQYQAQFSCEQGVYLTYAPIFILGVKK
ncbi:biotin synthesis protein [Actinobacillus pleuropneumoniae serovar 3 str. JL03]|uniref:Malonyl-[acyl-carrier protein] O-methyltransferase n=1 Tax=Actinobacillus pleuropneumoniae serotype 3 (strain JL03) TaxID=434271 RepID=B0BPM2_ACTPJ|nr:malonyl-ACP O-methyltransferase BioC [Actinobacillus pleuropneumoniae]ABY69507.1 biotin synthesis protein [Actinobacillus pleuropneumoniae serovar 3 str. JL03]UKH14473.1 malonyl-[acyl-carrier protein] O-methyltransferase BioC [Actinobacillus pleuropneumoniae]UKH43652.1 malonyl-[acyl-carrier protein] O-methyltransferase BioC [Actinobacillus pleuropneumoniae]